MNGVIDRFEGKFAVIESEHKKMVNVETGRLSMGVKEGDCINCFFSLLHMSISCIVYFLQRT